MSDIFLKPLDIASIQVSLEGTTPYMPEPMDMAVLDRYDKKKSKQVYDKDDISEEDKAKEKYYFTKDGEKGIPARAFYNAMIRASRYLIDKTDGGMGRVREAITVHGDILPLTYDRVEQITHWGRTAGRTQSPRKIIRNAFYGWGVTLDIDYNAEQLSAENILNILNWAGFHIGVGAFRKENSGNFGLFKIIT